MGCGSYSDDDDVVMDLYADLKNGRRIHLSKLDDNIFVGIVIRFIKDKIFIPKDVIKSSIEANSRLSNPESVSLYRHPKKRLDAVKDQDSMLKKAYKKQILLHTLLVK